MSDEHRKHEARVVKKFMAGSTWKTIEAELLELRLKLQEKRQQLEEANQRIQVLQQQLDAYAQQAKEKQGDTVERFVSFVKSTTGTNWGASCVAGIMGNNSIQG
jgi:hypothetical protein